MLHVKIICVGKLKEQAYTALCDEYRKRLSRFCRVEVVQLEEQRLPERPSGAQIAEALPPGGRPNTRGNSARRVYRGAVRRGKKA